ncbi:MAG: hypothetical protein V3U87_11210 [Methylococcaceae bacterium]
MVLKKNFTVLIIGLLFFCSFLISGCDQSLSEKSAKKMILEKEKNNSLEQMVEGYLANPNINEVRSKDTALLSRLESLGFIEIIGVDRNNNQYKKFLFTDKAKPYVRQCSGRSKCVNIGTINDVEITGIRKDTDRENTVECTLKYQTTPLGEVFKNGEYFEKEGIYVFNLYQDGWRIKK